MDSPLLPSFDGPPRYHRIGVYALGQSKTSIRPFTDLVDIGDTFKGNVAHDNKETQGVDG